MVRYTGSSVLVTHAEVSMEEVMMARPSTCARRRRGRRSVRYRFLNLHVRKVLAASVLHHGSRRACHDGMCELKEFRLWCACMWTSLNRTHRLM